MSTSKQQFTTVDEYIASLSPAQREVAEELRKIIHSAVPGIEETISYNMPTFSTKQGTLVYFASWKKHTSLYPVSQAMETSIAELANYTTSGRGTVQFPLDQPLPVELIRELIAYRQKELQAK